MGRPRVAIVCPQDREERERLNSAQSRFDPVLTAFADRGVAAELAPYRDDRAEAVRRQLAAVDAALVWINPLEDGRDRSVLDGMLAQVAASGVFVSAHPDVIVKMGTKEVLFRTREMGWSTGDVHLYRNVEELTRQLPGTLASGHPRVLKQNRGNGGDGVWRIERADSRDTVRVLHALRGSREETMSLGVFLARCAPYFDRGGRMIDQPFVSPEPRGMVRCYLAQGKIVGFGHQHVTALVPPAPPPPPPRLYYPPSQPEFAGLRTAMEAQWVPELEGVLGLAPDTLPVIWDADFLCAQEAGPPSYLLCEINVSAVHPFPPSALAPLVEATLRRIRP